ncbi:hypothetical protein [Streptomyces sp. NBC_00247]|nr:hypothetical protein [Streptomyces sp. NBC_00247]
MEVAPLSHGGRAARDNMDQHGPQLHFTALSQGPPGLDDPVDELSRL